uniref:Ig-like domain-containing protein n=1 Tax=Macrostomum lignano TaxID=282301 RepID=A0A1I8FEL6_9PLAT
QRAWGFESSPPGLGLLLRAARGGSGEYGCRIVVSCPHACSGGGFGTERRVGDPARSAEEERNWLARLLPPPIRDSPSARPAARSAAGLPVPPKHHAPRAGIDGQLKRTVYTGQGAV